MVLCPGDALRSSGNPRILVLRGSSDSLTEMAVGKDRHFIAQIIQAVETAAYRRMLVRIQLERIRSAPRPYTGRGVKPSFSRRSLWVSLKPCRKRDEVV